MDRNAEARKIARNYIERHGDRAVEVIRRYCVEAHRKGHYNLSRAWRDIGVAADEILSEWSERRFDTSL